MHKKQLEAISLSAVASVKATANADAEQDEPELTEIEARTLYARKYRKVVKQLVADACGVELEDVVWVNVEPKKRTKKADDATDTDAGSETETADAA